jgi:hypothetical protein
MGAYDSKVAGKLHIEPPLNDREIRALHLGTHHSIVLSVKTREEELDDGRMVVSHTASQVRPMHQGWSSFYTLKDDTTVLVSRVTGFGKTVFGRFIRMGIDSGDIEVISVKDGQVTSEQAQLVIPSTGEVIAASDLP